MIIYYALKICWVIEFVFNRLLENKGEC